MFGRKHRKVEKPIDVDLPITPMLDMSFQLMAFFIVTFKPMKAEGQLAMYLPKTDDVAMSQAELPPEVPEDKQDEYKVQVTARGDGTIATLAVQGPASVYPIADTGQGKLYNLFDYLDKSITKPKDKKGPSIKIEAQNNLVYSQLILLMDICRRANFKDIGVGPLNTQPGKE